MFVTPLQLVSVGKLINTSLSMPYVPYFIVEIVNFMEMEIMEITLAYTDSGKTLFSFVNRDEHRVLMVTPIAQEVYPFNLIT